MRWLTHVLGVVTQGVRYGLATRRVSLIPVLILGLLLLALVLATGATAPLILYPFA